MTGAQPESSPLAQLDLGPLLAAGGDPWAAVGAALAGLPADGLLALRAPAPADALVRRLEAEGYRVAVGVTGGPGWNAAVQPGGAPAVADFRDLAAPEPLERVLEAAARLAPGAALLARVPRYPRLLLPRLAERGLAFEVREEPDGTALVHVRRPA